MNVPLVDLRAQYLPLKEEIYDRVERILEGMHLFLAENVQGFEAEFAGYCGTRYGIGVSDGTTALNIILRAMGIGPGDEVITVSHTFIATIEAILLVGAKPVFVDIDPVTCLIDVAKVEGAITPRTKAILPVHLYGQAVDMDPLVELAHRYGLRLIEDACQAHGAEYKGRKAGSLADAAAFSFYFSKNLGAYGEGGFITTNDESLARTSRMIRDHGSELRYHHDRLGFNGRLDEIQAAVLRTKLPCLSDWNDRRREHASAYNRLMQDLPIQTPVERPENRHIFHLYVIQALERDALQAWLKDRGIATGIHYPVAIHQQKVVKSLVSLDFDLPATERVVGEILSLPMYPELSVEQIEYVAAAVRAFYEQG
jgi:dTDP-4-amino-4,6-dideoxygalactose transaminase